MSEIPIIISTGTIIFLIAAGFITFFFYSYQQRLKVHLKEKEEIKILFQNENLKAQVEVQEQTFNKISQELHDNIGQILSLTKLTVSTINPHDYDQTLDKIKTSKELLDQAIDDLRNLSKILNTKYISHLGLNQFVDLQIKHFENSHHYQITNQVNGEEWPLHPEKKLIVFRIIQEIFQNIIKHAKAKLITVVTDYTQDNTVLSIQDDGIGFDADKLTKGLGLDNLYYRASLIGAQLVVHSKPGEGTLVKLTMPVFS